MNSGYFDSIFDGATTAQKVPSMTSATNLESFGATVDSIGSLTMAAFDWYNLEEAKDPWWSDREPSVKLTVDDANKKYGVPGKLSFDSDIREDAAKLMYDRKKKEVTNEEILGQRTSGQTLMSIPQSIAASILDPVNLAASFIPIVGEARLLKLGQTAFNIAKPTLAVRAGAKAIAGAANAAITTAPIQMATAGLLSEYQADYDMNSALVDTAYAAVGGAVLHAGLGLAVDTIRGARLKALTAKPETKVAVAANAAAELASGKPVTSAEVLLSLDPNNVKSEVQVQNIADVVVEPGRVEPVDPAKPFGVGEVPQHYVADFKFDPNAGQVEINKTAYVNATDLDAALNKSLTNVLGLADQKNDLEILGILNDPKLMSVEKRDRIRSVIDIRRGFAEAGPGEIKPGFELVSFNTKYFGKQENVAAPVGAITPDDVGAFVSAHDNLRNLNKPQNQKALVEIWQYLANLGLKHDDIDWSIPYSQKTPVPRDKLGMPIAGVQSQVFFLTGDKSGYIVKISGQFSGEAPIDLELPGLTTVAINERLITLPGGSKVRVQIGERIYNAETLGAVKHLSKEKGISSQEALDLYKNLSDKEKLEVRSVAKETIEEVKANLKDDINKKFREKNFDMSDATANPGNYGARLPDNFNNPLNGLVLDTGGFQWARPEDLKLLALQEIRAQNAAAIQAQREAANLQKQIEDLLARKGANATTESTSWQPGDSAPIDVLAKDLVAQNGVRPEDANLDARMVAQDAEEIIAQFRTEMSETDLNILKDFDRLAKEAESAEAGFLQAANCVINNLL